MVSGANPLAISCGLDVQATNSELYFSGTGALFYITTGNTVRIHGFQAYGNNVAGTYFVELVSANSLDQIYDNGIVNFGDLATGSGAGIYVNADSNSLTITKNVISGYGTPILSNGPMDTAHIYDNQLSSTVSRCVDLSNAGGAVTMQIQHNNATCVGGAMRIQGAGEYFIDDNEYEIGASVTNANSAAFEFLGSGAVYATRNRCTLASHASYCIWFGAGTSNNYSLLAQTKSNGHTVAAIGSADGTLNLSSTAAGYTQFAHNTATTGLVYASAIGPFINGPAIAPSGSCPTNGVWVFSQDGHATFCASGTWATKI
jgi:hypothetical protein